MKAQAGVVERLNTILSAELAAINQVFVHAKLCKHWGYERLHHALRSRSLETMKAADRLMGHLLYLDAVPHVHRMPVVSVGETVPELFALDLKLEQDLLSLLSEGVQHCAKVADFTTRHMLEGWARQTDARIEWIEVQLTTIAQLGLEPYLAEQIRDDG